LSCLTQSVAPYLETVEKLVTVGCRSSQILEPKQLLF
jgi:hypothetical protein